MEYRVNIDKANETKVGLSQIIDGNDKRLLSRVGAFASLFRIDVSQYSDPLLVLKTEEPGTKQMLVGDAVIAVASSGPHTNGYTLIRDLLAK